MLLIAVICGFLMGCGCSFYVIKSYKEGFIKGYETTNHTKPFIEHKQPEIHKPKLDEEEIKEQEHIQQLRLQYPKPERWDE